MFRGMVNLRLEGCLNNKNLLMENNWYIISLYAKYTKEHKRKAFIMQGLSSIEVEERKKQGLVNGNYSVKTKTIGQIISGNIFTLFNFINGFMGVLIIMAGSYKNLMFLGVVFWNLLIGIVQEIRSKIIIDRLSLLSEPTAHVIRVSVEKEIKIDDIVRDDVIILKSGKQICADAVVLSGECEVNESLLTGESEPVYKRAGDSLLSGSYLVSGSIIARVVNVGKDNYVNKITGQAKYIKKPNSEMLRSIKKIIKYVTILIIPVSVLMFLNQMRISGNDFENSVIGSVAAVIGMIPSGLVLLTSVVLAVSVIKLAKRNTLVQELYCIETLARVNVICFDKTGTLTEGKMEVEDLVSVCDKDIEGIKKLLNAYCSVFEEGNATSEAIQEYLGEGGEKFYDEIVKIKGFSSEKKYSAIEYKNIGTLALGAYEFIVKDKDRDINKRIEEFAKKGLRVVVFAWSTRPLGTDRLPEDMQPLAIVLLADKIRDEAEDTIEYFKKQGVELKVISGDNPATVSYVSKKVGIEGADNYIDATTLDTVEKIEEAVVKYHVFGRVTPAQKLEIVKALKRNGRTVAMTGDGANDVMALKESDCSVAMQSGADAARNVSQLVLLDSNFASMPYIVKEGRQTVNNIQSSAALYLNKTIYSAIFAIIFMFLPFAYPIQPIHLTLIGGLSIGIPSFLLAMEKNDNIIQGRFLDKVIKNAMPSGLMIVTNMLVVIGIGTYVGVDINQIETVCAYVVALGSFINLCRVCKPMNRFRAILVSSIAVLFVVLAALGREFFELHLLDLRVWIFTAIMAAVSNIVYTLYQKIICKVINSKQQ